MRKKIKVMVVDDSAFIRQLLTQMINHQEDMVCVGAAPDPLVARQLIKDLNPDVLTLDIEMPKMHGLEFLEKIMRLRPMPVIMISTLTERGSEIALKALELGAVEIVSKPKAGAQNSFWEYEEEITAKIRMAANIRLFPSVQSSVSAPLEKIQVPQLRVLNHKHLIAVGASTGGTEAIKTFLAGMPKHCPGIVIVQHMPPVFTKSFAQRLNTLCDIEVKEAQEGDLILPGHAYVAPGSHHLLIKRVESGYSCHLSHEPPVNRHCPSVDVLFYSVAKYAGAHAVGVMLTGMGRDGAAGMCAMREAGAYNFAQDEASCVVYGMPREAVAQGAVNESVSLNQLAGKVLAHLGYSSR